MARSNTGSSSNYLSVGSALVTGTPVTLACWFKASSASVTSNLMGFSVVEDNGYAFLICDGANAYGRGTGVILADDGVALHEGVGGAITDTTTWHHCCAVFASGASRTAYLDGTAGTPNTNSDTVHTYVDTYIGIYPPTFSPANGTIAEVGIWNVALSAAEIGSLAKGISPLFVRRSNLLGCWPIMGRNSPETSLNSTATFVMTGTMAQAAHPRIIYPSPRYASRFTTATSGSTGSGSIALSALTVAGSGSFVSPGSGSVALSALTVAGSGAFVAPGSGSITLPALTVAGSGAFVAPGSGSITLPALTVAGSGTASTIGGASGAGTPVLTGLTVAGSGAFVTPGSGAINLAALTVAGSGSFRASGAGSVALAALTAAGSATAATISGAVASGAAVLSALTTAGSGSFTATASGSVVLAALTMSGTDIGPLQPGEIVSIVLTTDLFTGPHSSVALTTDLFTGPHRSVIVP